MARRVCLSIGVATVVPPKGKDKLFGYLDGAVIAANNIGEWARRSGFGDDNVRVVTDARVAGKANGVTRDRVQQAVDELFPAGAEPVSHMILSFCGHGVTDANIKSINWLFSDSLKMKYRVLASAFYEELLLHGIERITLISDACREGPTALELLRLDAVRGIVVDSANPVATPRFDQLAACRDGQLGYMVADNRAGDPGKCVFSGVVADVLWGNEPSAIENGKITTAGFGVAVEDLTIARAKSYKLDLNPDCVVNPRAAVLYDAASPPLGPAQLQPWPPAGAGSVMGASVESSVTPGAKANIERLDTDSNFRTRVLGKSFGAGHIEFRGGGLPGGGGSAGVFASMPESDRDMLNHVIESHQMSRKPGFGIDPHRLDMIVRRVAAQAAARARKTSGVNVRRSVVQIKPSTAADASNLLVAGPRPVIWSHGPVEQRRRTAARTGFRVDVDAGGMPILVEIADGRFTPVVPYKDLYTIVKEAAHDDIFQAYGSVVHVDAAWQRDAFRQSLAVIGDFAAGKLGAGDLDDLATKLRANKHADPVLGVISAYLYRALADFDSIRRMAYFYVQHGQPVPFDIALLGAMNVTRTADGLVLDVPAVKARKRGKGEAELPSYITVATSDKKAKIGGRCPWLASGWDYVGLAARGSEALVEGLAEHARDVPRRAFTALPVDNGRALAKLWSLEAR